MNLQNGEYIIRCFLDDLSNLCYISGPPNVDPRREQPSPHAIVKHINRDMRIKKIREEDFSPECFVEVIHHDNVSGTINRKYGTILLRQSGTTRYAAVYQKSALLSKAKREAPKISFINMPDPDAIRKAAEFQLVAPTGNEADGVAILSMNNDCYVEIRESSEINYLYPVCDDISQLPLQDRFAFEKRFGYF